MLAVDREEKPFTPLPGGDGEVARGDEALLVRERERDAALERPERSADASEADDRVQHEIWLGGFEDLGEVATDLHVFDPVSRREIAQWLRAGGEGDELEIRVRIDDLERLPPDRARGPEQRDPLEVVGHVRRLVIHVFRGRYARAIARSLHRYGDDASQLGELFLPDGQGLHPVVIVIHGGYWKARYDRSLMNGLCENLAGRGSAAWNLEYRRVGNGGGWPETFDDVAAGVDLLSDLEAPLDLERIGAIGHSAGGHLALWAASRTTLSGDAPGAAPKVVLRAVVSQAGVADLRLAAVTSPSGEPTQALLGGSPDELPERYALASPRERLPLGVEQLMLHGENDETVSVEISKSYAAAAEALADPCELRMLSGTGHFEHIDASTDAWQIARDWLEEKLS